MLPYVGRDGSASAGGEYTKIMNHTCFSHFFSFEKKEGRKIECNFLKRECIIYVPFRGAKFWLHPIDYTYPVYILF